MRLAARVYLFDTSSRHIVVTSDRTRDSIGTLSTAYGTNGCIYLDAGVPALDLRTKERKKLSKSPCVRRTHGSLTRGR